MTAVLGWRLWRVLWLAALLVLALMLVPATAFAQDGDVIDPTSDLGMWSLLVGVLLPALVAFVQQPGWPNWLRTIVGVVSSLVAGFVTTWLNESGALWDQGMIHAMLLVGVSSWASYVAFWKPSSLGPKIEYKTSGKDAPPAS